MPPKKDMTPVEIMEGKARITTEKIRTLSRKLDSATGGRELREMDEAIARCDVVIGKMMTK